MSFCQKINISNFKVLSFKQHHKKIGLLDKKLTFLGPTFFKYIALTKQPGPKIRSFDDAKHRKQTFSKYTTPILKDPIRNQLHTQALIEICFYLIFTGPNMVILDPLTDFKVEMTLFTKSAIKLPNTIIGYPIWVLL